MCVQLVLSEVADDASMDLQAVKLLATYLSPGLREPGEPPARSLTAPPRCHAGPRKTCRTGRSLPHRAGLWTGERSSGLGRGLGRLLIQQRLPRAPLAKSTVFAPAPPAVPVPTGATARQLNPDPAASGTRRAQPWISWRC